MKESPPNDPNRCLSPPQSLPLSQIPINAVKIYVFNPPIPQIPNPISVSIFILAIDLALVVNLGRKSTHFGVDLSGYRRVEV